MMNGMQPDVQTLLAEGLKATDEALDQLLPPASTPPASIHQAIRHSTFAGGKRLPHPGP